MHVSYSSILVGAVGLSQYNARDFVNLGGGGSSGNFLNFKGVEEFSGSRGMRIYGRLTNFQYPREGWPMSDNNIFQGGSDLRRHYGPTLKRSYRTIARG